MGPWLPFWSNNGWLHASPSIAAIADASVTRVLVSAAGALTMLAGLGELGAFLLGRDRRAREAEVDGKFQ